MTKKTGFEKTKFGLLLFVDAFSTLLAWFLAYFLRFFILPGAQKDSLGQFALLSLVAVIATIFFQSANKLYQTDVSRTWTKEVGKLLGTSFEVFLFFVAFYYFFFPRKVSRLALLLFFTFHFVGLVLFRTLLNSSFSKAFRKGRFIRRILLVGYGERLENYFKAVTSSREFGLKISGHYLGSGKEFDDVDKIEASSLQAAADQAMADLVIISFPEGEYELEKKTASEGIGLLEQKVFTIPNIPKTYVGSYISEFHSIPMISINGVESTFMQRALKRTFDIVSCSLGVAVLSPVLLLIALIVKLSSKGPVLFKQKRVTRDGKVFTMYKFRSMRIDMNEGDHPHWTEENDPRITKIGRLIRKTSIDELPQFFNVIGGSMSLIGPRPERPELEEQFVKEIPGYYMRHRMKAGISGWAQVNGLRGNTSLTKRIDFDLYYIKNWTLGLDFKIIFLTFFKGFINKNAY